MKYVLCLGILFLGLVSASAQTSTLTTPSTAHRVISVADADGAELTATELLHHYVTDVDGTLRDLGDQMRMISEKVEAGEVTQPAAQALKLAIARIAIARLETISAVYEAVTFLNTEDKKLLVVPGQPSDSQGTSLALTPKPTVSTEELRRENSR